MAEPSSDYEAARKTYWDAQQSFRQAAQDEIRRLLPEGVHGILVSFETEAGPRLRLDDFLNSDGTYPNAWPDDESVWINIDQILADMEVMSWEEAKSLLFRRAECSETFVIEKQHV
ncbi:MAG TPA: hypothetical protein VFU07_05355 [Candidatus Lumbricidophila sp.]|nr:hypothetical protein [Candidatus Lumbricidophila sp.]